MFENFERKEKIGSIYNLENLTVLFYDNITLAWSMASVLFEKEFWLILKDVYFLETAIVNSESKLILIL